MRAGCAAADMPRHFQVLYPEELPQPITARWARCSAGTRPDAGWQRPRGLPLWVPTFDTSPKCQDRKCFYDVKGEEKKENKGGGEYHVTQDGTEAD